jgi:hypothetical protein
VVTPTLAPPCERREERRVHVETYHKDQNVVVARDDKYDVLCVKSVCFVV